MSIKYSPVEMSLCHDLYALNDTMFMILLPVILEYLLNLNDALNSSQRIS